ncbi:MAG: redox-sensing transcriptional repressor Rex [Oscillospiraceae bacterium]|jgi:redox-sensing transcriptional repressor|nr:redox-sensing transcriptional repressor Rex [Oscillospiraceae bacterium]
MTAEARQGVSDAVVRRLPGYYRYLRELEAAGERRISSQDLSERMGLTASQIRQDLNHFGGFGQQGYGYNTSDLRQSIGEILGLNRRYAMVIVGAGNIGRAVGGYPTFQREGFDLCAVFDIALHVVGQTVHGQTVQPLTALDAYLATHVVDIAVLAVPAEASRQVFARLVNGGVRAVWNFAPVDLVAPPDVTVHNVHLTDSLYRLTFRMREKQAQAGQDAGQKQVAPPARSDD